MAIFCNCGSNNLETVVDRRVHAARRFYRATLCKRGLCCHVVSVCSSICLSVRPSVTFVDHVKTNKHNLEFFSPSGSHTFLVRQNVLQYLNNFTKHHGAVCQRQLSFLWKYSEAMVKKRPFFIPPFHLTCTVTYHPYEWGLG